MRMPSADSERSARFTLDVLATLTLTLTLTLILTLTLWRPSLFSKHVADRFQISIWLHTSGVVDVMI